MKISERLDLLEQRVAVLENIIVIADQARMNEVNAAYNYFKTHSTKNERDKVKSESNPDWIAIAEKMKAK